MREKFSWALTLTAVVAACLALAVCSAWAQGTTHADLAAEVHRQLQRLTDGNPSVRGAAAQALGEIGPGAEEAVPALIAALTKDSDARVRSAAAWALVRISPGAKEVIPALIAAVAKDPDADVRNTAARALGEIGPGAKEAVPALSAALAKDTNARVRMFGADALRQIGPSAKEAVPALSAALANDMNPGVRRVAVQALGLIEPGAKEVISVLSAALGKDTSAGVRSDAAYALGHIGPASKEAVPALSAALAKDPDAAVREAAALALGQIGPGVKEVIPPLSAALAKDPDADVRRLAVQALGHIGPGAKEAAPALSAALARDTGAEVRSEAAGALGDIGPGAKEAVPALSAALAKDPDQAVRGVAANALVQIAVAAEDSKRTDMIEELAQVAQVLEAKSFTLQASQVRTAVDVLRAIRPPWYEVLYEKGGKHPRIVGLVAVYLFLALLWLAILWKFPLVVWQINENLERIPKVKLPGWVGGAEISVANLLLVGPFQYYPRVLDAWISRHIASARDQFGRIATVQEREVHVDVPVELDRKVNPGLKPEDLKGTLGRSSARLLIWGEGGAGKTSLACQVARWGMSDDAAMRPCAQRMLPVMIEQDLNLEVGKDKEVLTEVIRGELRKLTGEAEAPDQELVLHLLKQKRVLLIVDGLSELSEATRNKIRPGGPEFPVNALIVTSRLEEPLDGVTKTTIHPMRVQGNRLSSFMEAYLGQRGKRLLFDDAEFFDGCRKLSEMVGDRDTTVLLAKLYAEQMIASKEGAEQNLPENIPDLMLQYLNELNRKQAGMGDRAVHSAAEVIAWECLRETYRPTPARIDAVLGALGGGHAAEERVNHLEKNLRIVQVIGAGRDRVKFALDPLAEYLAGLYLVEHYGDSEQLWREFLAKADVAPGAPEAIKGFLLAVRDCCLARGTELNVPGFVGFVADELASRAGLDPVALERARLKQRIKVLISRLKSPFPEDRISAADELGRMGRSAESAVSALVERLGDEQGRVRVAAAGALRDIAPNGAGVVSAVIRSLQDGTVAAIGLLAVLPMEGFEQFGPEVVRASLEERDRRGII